MTATHRIEIRVRYCECDPMGVVHHTVYPIWFEMGRTELLRATGSNYAQMEAKGFFLAVTSIALGTGILEIIFKPQVLLGWI